MIPSTIPAHVYEIIRLIGAGIVGGLIASYATHRFTLSRERASGIRNRRRDFRAFVVQFRSEAADRYHPDIKYFVMFYRDKIPNLRHAAATIADDFPRQRRVKFDELVSAASSAFTAKQASEADGRKHVIDSLDAILRFLDNA
jgi:hypothetical protein